MRFYATDSAYAVVAASERLGDQTGTRVIVTGATNGVGLGAARLLARAGRRRDTVDDRHRRLQRAQAGATSVGRHALPVVEVVDDGGYAHSKLAVMLWGLELDRRLRAAGPPVVSQLTHPGWVASNLSNISDSPVLALAHRTVKAVAGRLANDVEAGAAPTFYCLSEPIPHGQLRRCRGSLRVALRTGAHRQVVRHVRLRRGGQRVAFAERETGTVLRVCRPARARKFGAHRVLSVGGSNVPLVSAIRGV